MIMKAKQQRNACHEYVYLKSHALALAKVAGEP